MAMSVGPPGGAEEDEVVSAINTTPLVDVMLVLLIIFLITIPVVTTSVPVLLPKERNEVRETRPENIVISVDQGGRIYWNDLRIANTNILIDRLKKIAVLTPQPEVQIRGDGRADYEAVGRVIYACQRAGIAKVGFITEPPVRGGGRVDDRKQDRSHAMAMNVGPIGRSEPDVMIDINTTPLIDVMLVLLVMLIITIPIQLHSVNLNMPIGQPPPPLILPEVVKL